MSGCAGRHRIHWDEQERRVVLAGVRELLPTGMGLLDAVRRAMTALPEARRRTILTAGQLPWLMEAIYQQTPPAAPQPPECAPPEPRPEPAEPPTDRQLLELVLRRTTPVVFVVGCDPGTRKHVSDACRDVARVIFIDCGLVHPTDCTGADYILATNAVSHSWWLRVRELLGAARTFMVDNVADQFVAKIVQAANGARI